MYDPERVRGAETRRARERKRKRRQAFLSHSSPCQSCKKTAKPIILSSSFFSGAAEASLDCHMYKGSPYKAIHSSEWTRHLWGFLISSSLFFSSFFQPCNQIWAKSNGGRIEREQCCFWFLFLVCLSMYRSVVSCPQPLLKIHTEWERCT